MNSPPATLNFKPRPKLFWFLFALLVVTAWFGTFISLAHATLPQQWGLVDLLQDANVQFDGAAVSDSAGRSVEGAGDLNGDGIDDVIIGAPGADERSRNDAGSVYAVFGKAAVTRIDLDQIDEHGDDGFRIDGASAGDAIGAASSITGVGDLNGDGLDDLAVTSGTRAFVVFGRTQTTPIDLAALEDDGIRLENAAAKIADVAGAGDVNGDGFADLLLGAPEADPDITLENPDGREDAGIAYVVFGKASTNPVDLSNPGIRGFRIDGACGADHQEAWCDQETTIFPDLGGDLTGTSVAPAGDLDSDGLDDLVVGAPGFSYTIDRTSCKRDEYLEQDEIGRLYTHYSATCRQGVEQYFHEVGVTYIVRGKKDNTNVDLKSSWQTKTTGVSDPVKRVCNGLAEDDPACQAALRGYGGEELIEPTVDLASYGAVRSVYIGGVRDGLDGTAVAGGRDLSGGGSSDIVIGAAGTEGNSRANSGSATVRFGEYQSSFRVEGSTYYDALGHNINVAGDFNNDGRGELIAGSEQADSNGRIDSGTVSVVFGPSSGGAVDLAAGIAGNGILINGAAEGDNAGAAVAGVGDFNGDDREDVIVGAPNADNLRGQNAGAAYIVYGYGQPQISYSPQDLRARSGASMDPVLPQVERTGEARFSIDPPLPEGLTFDESTGEISGTTTSEQEVTDYRVTMTDLVGQATADITLRVDPQARLDLLTDANLQIDGAASGDWAGTTVAGTGDFNDDGLNDVVVGAHGADSGGLTSGSAYVVFSQPTMANVDLADLQDYGVEITGAESGNYSGKSVSGAGDVNGDGISDVIIGAQFAEFLNRTSAGEAYVIFGRRDDEGTPQREDAEPVDLARLGDRGFRIGGEAAFDKAGWAVSGAGDVNNDGLYDVVVGAVDSDHNGRRNSGSAYIVIGKADDSGTPEREDTQTVDLASFNRRGFRIDGACGDDCDASGFSYFAGHSVAGAGDINGDGFGDVLVGDPGPGVSSAYIVLGKTTNTSVDLAEVGLPGNVEGIQIEDVEADLFDSSITTSWVEGAGDVNRDGLADVIVGSPRQDHGGKDEAGEVHVIFGVDLLVNPQLNRVDVDRLGNRGFEIGGVGDYDWFGYSVDGLGDVNDDGYSDLVVGAAFAGNNRRYDSGSAYLVYGKSNFDPVELSVIGNQGFRIDGATTGDNAGFAVSGAGIANGDERPDLVVGAPLADNHNRPSAGSAYVSFVRADPHVTYEPNTIEAEERNQIEPLTPVVERTGNARFSIDPQLPDGLTLNRETGEISGTPTTRQPQKSYTVTMSDIVSDATTKISIRIDPRFTQDAGKVDLLTDANVKIDGAADAEMSGSSVADAGDVNNDGRDDVIIGAKDADQNGLTDSGSAYVVFGHESVTSIDLNKIGEYGFRIDGAAASDLAGSSASGAGDVNNDGRDDLIVGAEGAKNNGRSGSGSAFVVFGKSSHETVRLGTLGSNGFRIDGKANSATGAAVAGAKDVNGDGYADVIVGAPHADRSGGGDTEDSGAAYVVFGSDSNTNVDLTALAARGFEISGAAAGDLAGFSVAKMADVNDDELADIVVGAPYADNNYLNNSGSVYAVFGVRDDPGTGEREDAEPVQLANLGERGYRIDGAGTNTYAGWSVAGGEDINGDGSPDAVVGVITVGFTRAYDESEAYVVFGKSTADPIFLGALGDQGFQIFGHCGFDTCYADLDPTKLGPLVSGGNSVAALDDFNDDDLADVVLGANGADNNARTDSGAAYVVYGQRDLAETPEREDAEATDLTALGTRGVGIDGAVSSDKAGHSVAAAGDLNNDGRPDLILGAKQADSHGLADNGSSYVLFGFGEPSVSYETGLLNAQVGSPIDELSPTLEHSGEARYSVSPALPEGLAIDEKSGVISGTPRKRKARRDYAVTMTDLAGRATTTLSIEVIDLGLPQRAGSVDLSDQANLEIGGLLAGANAGYSVSLAGDINGNGKAEMVVGAPGEGSGSVYVVFDRDSSESIDLDNLGTDGIKIGGAATGDAAGSSVEIVDDVNGDGYRELMIGAPNATNNPKTNSGSVYVIFGGPSLADLNLASLGDKGFRIDGPSSDGGTGTAISSAGDVNHDGLGDLLVSSRNSSDSPQRPDAGSAYVVYGVSDDSETGEREDAATVDLSALGERGFRIDGAAAGDAAGQSLSAAGDINRDGLKEIIVGAPGADNGARPGSGSTYVVFGSESPRDIDLQNLDDAGFRVDGAAAGDRSASALAAVGDQNDDGIDDFMLGAAGANQNGRSNSGTAYIVYGQRDDAWTPDREDAEVVDLQELDDRGIQIDGAATGDRLGSAVDSAGDIDSDGRADLAVSAPSADANGRVDAGTTYVLFGVNSPKDLDLSSLDEQGFKVGGAGEGDQAGYSVSGGTDVNGDNRDDLMIGAPFSDSGGEVDAGAAYITYGYGAPELSYKLDSLSAEIGEQITPLEPEIKRTGTASFEVSPTLPDGLELDQQTGVISGAPTSEQEETEYTVTMSDLTGPASAKLKIRVNSRLPQRGGGLDLLKQANIRIDGANGQDNAGRSIDSAGDVNGDGREDLVIGSPTSDNEQKLSSGNAYVLFGSSSLSRVDLTDIGTDGNEDGFRIKGAAAGDYAGLSVSGAGDTNGDGTDDVIVGAPYFSPRLRVGAGAAYVVFGVRDDSETPQREDAATVDLTSITDGNSTKGFRIDGARGNSLCNLEPFVGDQAGLAVAGGLDINDDGKKDVVIGAPYAGSCDGALAQSPGAAYVIFGRPTELPGVDLAVTGAPPNVEGFRIDGVSSGDLTGMAVAMTADMDGDLLPEAVVGAPHADAPTHRDAGSVFVVNGKDVDGKVDPTIDLAYIGQAGNKEGFKIIGSREGDESGWSVAGVGDMSDDQKAEVIVGSRYANNTGRPDAGSASVVFSKVSDYATVDLGALGERGFQVNGATYDYAGWSVAGSGDLNEDGKPDLIVGAYSSNANSRTDAGSAYALYGKSSTKTIDLLDIGQSGNSEGFRIDGAGVSDRAGASVADIGDLNNDHKADVVVAASGADNNSRENSGSVYIVHGFGATRLTYNPDTVVGGVGEPINPLRPSEETAYTGTPSYSVEPELPDGLTLNKDTGVISGTPLEPQPATEYTVALADLAGRATDTVSIRVDAPITSHDLLTEANLRIDGASIRDQAGFTVAAAGDVNGDRKDDVIVGAPEADANGREGSGRAYVVFGQPDPTDIDLDALGPNGFQIDGAETGDKAGSSVAGVPDMTGDGRAEIVVGAPRVQEKAGAAYVVFGKSTDTAVNLAALGTGGFVVQGASEGDQLGYSVAGSRDINKDGKPDLVVGAPYSADRAGAAYVVFGKSNSTPVNVSALGSRGFAIAGSGDGRAGFSVASAGDANADGYTDVLIGAPSADFNNRNDSGSVFTVFGANSTARVDLGALGSRGYRVDGAWASAWTGYSVARLGDLDGDGFDDTVIGAPYGGERPRAGSVYVVYGKPTFTPIDLNGVGEPDNERGIRLDGENADDQLGSSVAGATDMNGDRRPDILAGAPFADNRNRSNAGAAYVIFGSLNDAFIDLRELGPRGYRLDGAAAGDQAGISLAHGDVNGDHTPDILVGAHLADNRSREDSGSVYTLYGPSGGGRRLNLLEYPR